MIYDVLLLLFIFELTLNWICSSLIDNFVRQSATNTFSPTTTNIYGEIISYLVQVYSFQLKSFNAICQKKLN